MLFNELNDDNFILFAIKNYENPQAVTKEDFIILPSISLRGTSIFKSLTLISMPHIPSGSLASIPTLTISLQVAPSWGNVITQ